MVVLQALVGHQYGTASLPTQVEVSEYELLLQESQRAGISTQELERVYQRDENTNPPSYCLRPPRRHTCCPQVTSLNLTNTGTHCLHLHSVMNKILKVNRFLSEASNQCKY